ncbi:hypothetical protein RRG08_028666 [Elysia crispata]|uniref:Uncharacterized protein n=1 Tax=Elysia crispata TaxID=231223 RepID=A0AAE0ZC23_9GAST|nr:hypothetical protein RRG08_028666 [Elysia crispata]
MTTQNGRYEQVQSPSSTSSSPRRSPQFVTVQRKALLAERCARLGGDEDRDLGEIRVKSRQYNIQPYDLQKLGKEFKPQGLKLHRLLGDPSEVTTV